LGHDAAMALAEVLGPAIQKAVQMGTDEGAN
jgi:hypothetical protein